MWAARSSAVRRVGSVIRAGKQAVGDGLGIHVGEALLVQIVDKRATKRLHERRERAGLVLDRECRPDAVADGAGERGETLRELLRGSDDLAMTECEGPPPLLAPPVNVSLVVGPSEVLVQIAGDGVEMERRVAVVPNPAL